MNGQDETRTHAALPARAEEPILRAVASLRRAKTAQMLIAHTLWAACIVACLAAPLVVAGLWGWRSVAVLAVMAVAVAVGMTLRASRRLNRVQMAKDADDYLGVKDTLASALDFLRGKQQDWMRLETIAAGAELAPKVRPFAVYRPSLPRGLAVMLIALVGLDIAAYAGAQKVKVYLAEAARSEASPSARGPRAPEGTQAKKMDDAPAIRPEHLIERIEVVAAAEDSASGNPAPTNESAGGEQGKGADGTSGAADAKPPGDGRVAKDKFADFVTRIDPEAVKDLELQKTQGGKGADEPPVLKLDSAQIEEMLKAIKAQKEERKKDEAAAAQVGVGIQAKAPPGSKTTSGSPGAGGGGEQGGGQAAMRTEDTRVQPRRVVVQLVDLPIPVERIKGADPQNPKDEDKSGRVGDAAMLISRKGAQAEQALEPGQLAPAAAAAEPADAPTGWIPFGMKDYVRRYFEVLQPKETRR